MYRNSSQSRHHDIFEEKNDRLFNVTFVIGTVLSILMAAAITIGVIVAVYLAWKNWG